MTDFITLEHAVDAVSAYLYPELLRTEDFDAFESFTSLTLREIATEALRRCIENFDEALRQSLPRGWTAHEREKRSVITLLGKVTYSRTIFLDSYGSRRCWCDELLGIPSHSRLSSAAFLWIATCAAELSYRKTAEKFAALTGETISQVTVMNIVHNEGALLKAMGAEFACEGMKVSQDRLFVESDGLWVHYQSPTHRKKALPRFLYEQSRKTVSCELKLAALYAGKIEVAPGRFERGGLCLTCCDGDPDTFWARVWQMINKNYEIDDVNYLAVGGDGAAWCGSERLELLAPKNCEVRFFLDPFHLLQKTAQAFPDEGPVREWAFSLAIKGKGKRLAEMCLRVSEGLSAGRRRDRVKELSRYALTNAAGISPMSHKMGTMEGTNAHVGAARLKGQGRSWSRRGAEAMCLIRCALASRRALVAPSKQSWFSAPELIARENFFQQSLTARTIPLTEGSGWEPPHTMVSLPKSVAIPLWIKV